MTWVVLLCKHPLLLEAHDHDLCALAAGELIVAIPDFLHVPFLLDGRNVALLILMVFVLYHVYAIDVVDDILFLVLFPHPVHVTVGC